MHPVCMEKKGFFTETLFNYINLEMKGKRQSNILFYFGE